LHTLIYFKVTLKNSLISGILNKNTLKYREFSRNFLTRFTVNTLSFCARSRNYWPTFYYV